MERTQIALTGLMLLYAGVAGVTAGVGIVFHPDIGPGARDIRGEDAAWFRAERASIAWSAWRVMLTGLAFACATLAVVFTVAEGVTGRVGFLALAGSVALALKRRRADR